MAPMCTCLFVDNIIYWEYNSSYSITGTQNVFGECGWNMAFTYNFLHAGNLTVTYLIQHCMVGVVFPFYTWGDIH